MSIVYVHEGNSSPSCFVWEALERLRPKVMLHGALQIGASHPRGGDQDVADALPGSFFQSRWVVSRTQRLKNSSYHSLPMKKATPRGNEVHFLGALQAHFHPVT